MPLMNRLSPVLAAVALCAAGAAEAKAPRGGPVSLRGDHGYTATHEVLGPGAVVDARGGVWRLNNSRNRNPNPSRNCGVGDLPVNKYPLRIQGADGGTLLGGHVIGEVPTQSAASDTYCNSAGVLLEGANITVRGTRVDQAWDGIRANPPAGSGVRLEGVWVNGARDDCVENDGLASLELRDSLLDGCFSGVSIDRGACKGACPQGPRGTRYVLDGVLIRLRPYPLRQGDGSLMLEAGPFLKTSAPTPRAIEITNSVFAFEGMAPRMYGSVQQGWDKMTRCSNNRLLYLGGNALPRDFPKPPSCFTVVTGAQARSEWERAKAAWLARR